MKEQFTTWEACHPGIATSPTDMIPWPCERFSTELGSISQPVISKGPDDELITTTHRHGPDEPTCVYHSTDGGRNWAKLSEIPAKWEAGQQFVNTCSGCGYLKDGTIVVQFMNQFNDGQSPRLDPATDSSHGRITYVVRSTDHGKSWSDPVVIDPWPFHKADDIARIYEANNGLLYLPLNLAMKAEPNKPLKPEQLQGISALFVSEDKGITWRNWGNLGANVCENDLLSLEGDRMIAVLRYQRTKIASDPADLITPYYLDPEHHQKKPDCPNCKDPKKVGGHSVYKQTAINFSYDAGRTWTRPRIVTGWLQQTGCILSLSDGTLVLPFGHKDQGQGQRFIVSYDQGQTWSKAIFELNKDGMYANSVVLEDDTIVTLFSVQSHSGGHNYLEALRWKAPSKEIVSEKGFFTPLPVQTP